MYLDGHATFLPSVGLEARCVTLRMGMVEESRSDYGLRNESLVSCIRCLEATFVHLKYNVSIIIPEKES